MNTSISVERLSAADFSGLREDWNALLDRSAATSPFLRWEWMHSWWTAFGEDHDLFLLAFRREGHLIGLAPLLIQTSSLGVRRVGIISDWLADNLDIIGEAGSDAVVSFEMWRFLHAHSRLWDVVRLRSLRHGSAANKCIPTLSLLRRSWSRVVFHNFCRVVRTTDDFPTYLETRPGLKYRRNFSKKIRRLVETEKAVLVGTDRAGADEAVKTFITMHKRRSFQMGRRSAFFDPRVVLFMNAVSGAMSDAGLARFLFLRVGAAATSCYVGFEFKNRISLFQSGIDPDWMSLSAGAVLTFLVIKDAFERKVFEVDFLSGEEAYKDIWATDRITLNDVFVYRFSPRGIAVYGQDLMRRIFEVALRRLTRNRLAGAAVDALKRHLLRRKVANSSS